MSKTAINERESVNLQEIDVELIISKKIYLKKTARIRDLKESAGKEFKHYGHDFDYFVANHELVASMDTNNLETLAHYKTNKIVLKPCHNYKNQYEDVRKTLGSDEEDSYDDEVQNNFMGPTVYDKNGKQVSNKSIPSLSDHQGGNIAHNPSSLLIRNSSNSSIGRLVDPGSKGSHTNFNFQNIPDKINESSEYREKQSGLSSKVSVKELKDQPNIKQHSSKSLFSKFTNVTNDPRPPQPKVCDYEEQDNSKRNNNLPAVNPLKNVSSKSLNSNLSNQEEHVVEESHYKEKDSLTEITDNLVEKKKSHIRNEINNAQKNLGDLKKKLGSFVKGAEENGKVTDLLVSKSNDIISNANNFMKKYMSGGDLSQGEKADKNNDSSEVACGEINSKEKYERHEKEKKTVKNKFNYEEKVTNPNEVEPSITPRDNKYNYEDNPTEKQKATIKQTINSTNQIPIVKDSSGKKDRESRKLSTSKQAGILSQEQKNIEEKEREELLLRIDKLLISNGLLDRTNKELVLHLKSLEEEVEYLKKLS